jgi:Protein of unknown function, DUF547
MNRRALMQLSACALIAVPQLWGSAGALAQAASGKTAMHDSYDALLQRYVQTSPDGVNRVDYAKWKASAADLKALKDYIAVLAGQAPSKMARNEAFAYWANLYNAITLDVVLGRFPVKSIRDIKSDGLFDPKAYTGPWRSKRVTVEGRQLSLDDIEHETMRPTFKDPRVHYSVNCASFGCPNLPNKAWRAETLDADLDVAAREFINHKRGVSVVAGKLRVSSIYKWFRDDFGADDAAVIAHFAKYASPELKAQLSKTPSIGEDQYDWTLNVIGSKGS